MGDNTPSLEELKSFYESESYQSALNEFSNRTNKEFDKREFVDMFTLFFKLSYCQRRYMILDVPFQDVLSEFEKNKDRFLDYQVAATEHFNEHEIDTTYLIEKFCEFYLLQTGNQERLLHYLIIVRSNISFSQRKYLKQITKLYKQTVFN